MGLQQAVELLEVRHNVVLDVGDGYLQAHAATVKGASAVPREHLADHARHHWNNLSTEERGRVTSQRHGTDRENYLYPALQDIS